jgi:hypothetical protein
MKYILRILIFLLLLLPKNVCAISWFTNYRLGKAYQQKDYKKVRDILEKEQVDNPNDAQLNYNLGAVYYKLNQIERAKNSFDRCVKNCSADQKALKEISHFNLGNCLYKICLEFLPKAWEKMETIEDQKLNPAISQVQGAVENFNNVLTLNDKNKKAKVNQKKAQELLEKLLKKRKPQQNQQQQQDKQNQDQQEKHQSKDQKSQDGSEQKQDQKDLAEKDDKNKKNQQQQQKGQDGAQESADKGNDGADNKFQDKQEAQKDKGVSQESTHDQDSQKNEQQTAQSEENGTKEEQEKQAQAAFGQEGKEDGLKERGFRVILDDLQSDESKMQKMVIKQKSKGQETRLDSKQKPW